MLYPASYEVIFDCPSYPGRNERVTVLAEDVCEALSLAQKHVEHGGSLRGLHPAKPRWMQTDTAFHPTIISPAVLQHYAEKLGLSVTPKSE